MFQFLDLECTKFWTTDIDHFHAYKIPKIQGWIETYEHPSSKYENPQNSWMDQSFRAPKFHTWKTTFFMLGGHNLGTIFIRLKTHNFMYAKHEI